jgi:molybdopterin synthase catalytic subunit/molybdopterin converting factor small subunit
MESQGKVGGWGSTPCSLLLAPLAYSCGVDDSFIRVRLVSFGPLKAAFGEGGAWRSVAGGESVGGLLRALRAEGTIAEAAVGSLAVAVNQEYAKAGQVLADGDEVAILPPVSGGVGALVRLVRESIDGAAILGAMKVGADGAVCVFDGMVRDNTRGRQTLHLDYEAYEEMALKQMFELRAEAIAAFGVREVAIVHRLGRLGVGETSVLIVVASAHRGAGLDACRWVIDTLKKTVPIWKKEQFADGAVWADGEPFPEAIAGSER